MYTNKELWTAACLNDIKTLKEYYSNSGKPGIRIYSAGKFQSLIYGAYLNKNFEIVRYLVEVGETIEPHENYIDLDNYR